MRLANHRSIKELLALLPDGTLRPDDLTFLTITRSYIHALREYTVIDAAIFTGETRLSLAMEITSALAELLESRVPKRSVGRPATRGPGRPAAPLKNEIAAFKERLAMLALAFAEGWHLEPDERPYAQPRAALDKAYTALIEAGKAQRLDITPLMDTMERLRFGLDNYATRTFSEAPLPLLKTTVGAQMNLVLKTLQREATSSPTV